MIGLDEMRCDWPQHVFQKQFEKMKFLPEDSDHYEEVSHSPHQRHQSIEDEESGLNLGDEDEELIIFISEITCIHLSRLTDVTVVQHLTPQDACKWNSCIEIFIKTLKWMYVES